MAIILALFSQINILLILEKWNHRGKTRAARKPLPPGASSLFVCVEVRHQLQFRKLFIGDAAQLVQGTVCQFQQFAFAWFQMSAHVCQLLHPTGAAAGIADAHQVDLVKCKAAHVTALFPRSVLGHSSQICLWNGSVLRINARHAQRYAAEQLIGDRPGERGKLRDRRCAVVPAAEYRDDVAHGGVRNIGHIQHAHVHADAPDLLYTLSAQQNLELSGKAALQTVRVPDGEHRERASCAPPSMCGRS